MSWGSDDSFSRKPTVHASSGPVVYLHHKTIAGVKYCHLASIRQHSAEAALWKTNHRIALTLYYDPLDADYCTIGRRHNFAACYHE